eukprot:2472249-Karenia_brevis.AAC.1
MMTLTVSVELYSVLLHTSLHTLLASMYAPFWAARQGPGAASSAAGPSLPSVPRRVPGAASTVAPPPVIQDDQSPGSRKER